MEIHLKIIGVLLILLALVHAIFPKYFNWKEELKSLSLVNQQMMSIHTFFIALIVFLMGVLCLTSTHELVETKLGKTISMGFAVFWSVRLIFQFLGYSSKLWKGKAFETIVHISFSGLWIYLSAVFWMNYLN
ncbi:hypothetical protein [Aureibacter tunicatorum]|uniref:Uncharacterized protein n=1 Tax=Aureibacter tunicatorum TaxID=866807 RepID=A0AAE4BSS8_9BACT|nr:hypothetical protein [Aureibacter tunicatorum]MDR6240086.1 hypothetical protein [Aureibacter tunicatorum]